MTTSRTDRPAGLIVINKGPWYGAGYCGICGDRDNIEARCVRYWDPDDGWKVGVLCFACADEAYKRGPREGDYALAADDRSTLIDVAAELLGDDLDGLAAEVEERS